MTKNSYSQLLLKDTVASHTPDRKTKIVATIGPASETEEQIAELIKAGLNVARFNTKHNMPEWHLSRIQRVRKVAKEMGVHIPILLDLQGPEVRLKILHGESFSVEKDQVIPMTSNGHHEMPTAVLVPQDVIDSLEAGKDVLFADGTNEFTVVGKTETEVSLKALDSFIVKDKKTVNTPGTVLNMPSLLPTDVAFIETLKEEGVEFVGLSFVRDQKDIDVLREELKKRDMDAAIIAKIENHKAIENLDELIAVSDAIMVARGDLGVELPFEQVPRWQKEIIKRSLKANKPVITATQMLLTMTTNPRPSRAEVNDIANAVLDGTDAVMLSEESASGKYPIKAVATQSKIAKYYENPQ